MFSVNGENERFENMAVTTVMCACPTVYLASLGDEEAFSVNGKSDTKTIMCTETFDVFWCSN